jgi:hypothetical protein
MANLSIKDFPNELLIEGRIEALSSGKTFRAWMIDLVDRGTGGQQETQQQTTRQKCSAPASPTAQRRATGQRGAKVGGQNEPLPRAETPSAPREESKRCSHGLLWHPGCTDE